MVFGMEKLSPFSERGRSQLDPDNVDIDRIDDHARKLFDAVFDPLFEGFRHGVDGDAELDDHIHVDVDAVSAGGDLHAPALRGLVEELGEAVGKTARDGFDDAVTFHRRLRRDLCDRHI